MSRLLVITTLILLIVLPGELHAQLTSPFSVDPSKYREQLISFMGPNLKENHKEELNLFLQNWESQKFDTEDMTRIIDVSSQFYGRSMRPVPHMYNFLVTLNTYIRAGNDREFLSNWLKGLSEIVFDPRISVDKINRYIRDTELMLTVNVLSESTTIRWKVKEKALQFRHDTVFKAVVENATLTCYYQKDSTEIYNVYGSYYPEIQEFHGKKGIITWEKAGYSREEVYAEISDFIISTAKDNFTIDSARLHHKTYFREPVYGVLYDKAIAFSQKEKADFPRFETYTKEFKLENLYRGVDYQGGLAFEGATVKGRGGNNMPARITVYKDDTLRITVKTPEFIFTKAGLTGPETSMAIYIGKDSIYHSNLSFSYNAEQHQVNFFRGNNPISRSPSFNSFHMLDMYFEYLSWNLDDSKIVFSRSRGSSIGKAHFESASFFDSRLFMDLAGIDEYHPLMQLKKFSEWYYSETFPVAEFAAWLNRPAEAVTGLCIDLANRGFLFYDRTYNEVTLKKKVNDFLTAFAKKKDYDILRFNSETKAPLDNAVLDTKNNQMTVNGVSNVHLSDSQKVAIFPYNQQIRIGRNRDMDFDGVVEAGLFTIFGHNFRFSYDTFKINLANIDSIRIAVEIDEVDAYGNPLVKAMDNLLELTNADLFIDDPDNKSGLKNLTQYPMVGVKKDSYIFYDNIPGLENVYPREDFYFRIFPFVYENIDHFKIETINLPGEFAGGNILKPMRQNLIVKDSSLLGFDMIIPPEGIELYGGKAVLYDSISMGSKGLRGKGTIKHLASTIVSEQFYLYPDSTITRATSFSMGGDVSGRFPSLESHNVAMRWLTGENEMQAVSSRGNSFRMFDNSSDFDGNIAYTPKSMTGTGIFNTSDSRITSDGFSFTSTSVKTDTSDFFLKSPSTGGYAFIAENAAVNVDFTLKTTALRLNTDDSFIKFPEIQYISKLSDFEYDMQDRILRMQEKRKAEKELVTPDRLLRTDLKNPEKPNFFATSTIRDTISFNAQKASYNLDGEYIEAENINYIRIADALIQPEKGRIKIGRRAMIDPLQNAVVAINNRHLLHSAGINIESARKYSGRGIYDYTDDSGEVRNISFSEVTVDTMATSARGFITSGENFMLSPAFTFTGDVNLYSGQEFLLFTGAAGIVNTCPSVKSAPVQFKSFIDPRNVMIPASDKPRDINGNPVMTGSLLNIDAMTIYPAFLSEQRSWIDVGLVSSRGYLYYDKAKSSYLLTSLEKIADRTLHGDLIALDRNSCILSGEGRINLGARFDPVKMTGAGQIKHNIDTGYVEIQALLGFDFHFSPEALRIMSQELKFIPTLKPVNLNSELYTKGMRDLFGVETANRMKEDLDLFGVSGELPPEFTFRLFLNDVTLYWHEASASFRSKGRIGLGFIGTDPVNVYVDGMIEIQRRRAGDMFDIYLKANESTWYYFSYIKGNMMTLSSNSAYNSVIENTRQRLRRIPKKVSREPYSYMIAVRDRMIRFLRRMESSDEEERSPAQDDPLRNLVR
ncbi:MAG TPA: hypothetical protein PLM01_01330 [Bacteroidales bacterium]|jgi:hypothetical protein|nr:hypothetical protein [Bacteroidales bacterium]HQJ81126.1 hypothetical protein [Bacteroidales bacterium]